MGIGSVRGTREVGRGLGRGRPALGISAFVAEEGGYTSLAVATALLVSLCLVFGAATAGWLLGRSSEVQRVADASALAGSNAVASYVTIAQVLDACVLSLGITGVVVAGAGLVLSAVPGLALVGAQVGEAGAKILQARQRFAERSAEGLGKLEATLPLIVAANSASCVAANSEGGISYTGCALPLPLGSGSEFSVGGAEVDPGLLEETTGRMGEASDAARDARDAADEALEAGWMADCGDSPYCLWQRADTLAGLPATQNPHYRSTEGWNFGVPLARARAYYAARIAAEGPEGAGAGELTNSCARRAFYEYALAQVEAGYYSELSDGSIEMRLPRLPRNTAEVKSTTLYTARRWPCTMEGGVRTLHASTGCPGATGADSGMASLSELDSGAASRCAACGMDVTDLGQVPAASTSIENGFEHHWRLVCDAAEDYAARRAELARAEAEMRGIAEEGAEEFDGAIDELAATRPGLCPPGAWGCVAVVSRSESVAAPTELTAAFLSGTELPPGAAVSAATLAPDEATRENNVLSRFFDGLSTQGGVAGLPAMICELWGGALSTYGSAYESVSSVVGDFLGGLDGVLGGTVAADLRDDLASLTDAAGFAPADLRMRKPVLANSQQVLDQAGYGDVGKARELVESLPSSGSPAELARALGVDVRNELGTGSFTVSELPIPGTGLSIPLTIDVGSLVGAT